MHLRYLLINSLQCLQSMLYMVWSLTLRRNRLYMLSLQRPTPELSAQEMVHSLCSTMMKCPTLQIKKLGELFHIQGVFLIRYTACFFRWNIHMPGMGNSAHSMNVYPSAQSNAISDYGTTEPDRLSMPGIFEIEDAEQEWSSCAFVDFKTCSSGAIKHMQGTFIYSSVGESMRLEYAKSRMGLRRHEKKE